MGISNYFTYAGRNSKTFGILIEETGSFRAAMRDYETIAIPGRSGELTIDNGRYRNVELTYKCGIGHDFETQMDEFFRWLMSNTGYKRLEDTYQADVYRMAQIKSAPEPSLFPRYQGGTFDVVFDCKPQRWLKSGEVSQTFTTGSGTITNPTLYDALPLIRAYGTGTLVIGSTTVTINSASTYTDIDCDIQDAYKGTVNCNGNITLNSGEFFKLKPGSNGIRLTGLSRIELTPRWWTI